MGGNKYCKCKLDPKKVKGYLTGTKKHINVSLTKYNGYAFLFTVGKQNFPENPVSIATKPYYRAVRPTDYYSNFQSSKHGSLYIYPGDGWLWDVTETQFKVLQLQQIASSGHQCYDTTSINGHKVYKVTYDATGGTTGLNHYVMVNNEADGWKRLMWPELWGKTARGYFKPSIMTSETSERNGTENNAPTDSSSSSAVAMSTLQGAEPIILTDEEVDAIDQILETSLSDKLQTENLYGVHYMAGAPFQFLKSADHRVNTVDGTIGGNENRSYINYELGRSYTENILVEAPIVYFLPGVPSFMAGADEAEKQIITNYITNRASEAVVEEFDELMSKYDNGGKDFGRYYDFSGKYSEYMRYVNLLCRAAAIFIGIGDRTVPAQPSNSAILNSMNTYAKYDWRNWGRTTNLGDLKEYFTENSDEDPERDIGPFTIGGRLMSLIDSIGETFSESVSGLVDSLIGDHGYFKCYMDPSSSFSEDMSSTSKTSAVAGLFDSASDLYKEAEFLLQDNSALSDLASGLMSGLSSVTAATGTLASNVGMGNMGKLLGLGSQVLQGANIAFPEMWGDSEYSRSYTVTVNLVSPYGDPESIFLNTIMPMMHLLALGLPRQSSANSFISPFLVRAFSPGIFSCDLGLVTGIMINKCPNGNDAYNVLGLPSEIQVQLQIKDLYSQLHMTSASHPLMFYNNQGLIDFLGVVCGLNFAQPTILVRIKTLWSFIQSSILDIPGEIYHDTVSNLSNITRYIAGMK